MIIHWRKLAILVFVLAMPLASAMATSDTHADEPTPVLLQTATKQLANNLGNAQEIYGVLKSRYATLSVPEQNTVDFLGGKIRILHGETEAGVKALEHLLRRDLDNNLFIEIHSYLAGVYALLHRFDEAFRAQLIAQNALRPETPVLVVMATISRSADMAADTGSYKDALEYASQLETLATPLNNDRYICRALTERGTAERGTGQLDLAEADFLAAREHCSKAGEQNAVSLISHYLAQTWMDMGQDGKAAALLDRMQQFLTPERYWAIGIADNEYLLGMALAKLGRWDRAQDIALKALALGQQLHYPIAIRGASNTLAQAYAHAGDHASAYKYLQIHLDAAKNVADDAQARSLAYARVRYEAEDKARQIQDLKRENHMLELEQALKAEERHNAYLLAAGAAAIIVLLCLLLYRQHKQRTLFRRLAETDSLTGISSRHHVLAAGDILVHACEDNGDRLAVILFDLDKFKAINDTHGHGIGDWALKAVVEACRPHIRARDVFGRFGGEEFIILARDMTPVTAEALAERCRGAIKAIDTRDSGAIFGLTASFGFAVSGVRMDGTPEPIKLDALIQGADDALYQAKAAGGDQAVDHHGLPKVI